MPGSRRKLVETDKPEKQQHVPSDRKLGLRTIDFPVIGVGASSGGLAAFTRFLDAFPASSDMAFILVQHLDPTHESPMAELLCGHTSLTVLEATDGMHVERDHLYIIPPAAFLTLGDGALCVRPSAATRDVRLPFDVLLQSMAHELAENAICVVLSGTGTDGSIGLVAVKNKGGFVIAQEPSEAEHDAMPRSAIATGAVDAVLPLADMQQAIRHQSGHTGRNG